MPQPSSHQTSAAPVVPEMADAARLQPDDVAERRHAEDQHFEEEALRRPDRQRLLEQRIEAPGDAQRQRYPGQPAGLHRQQRHRHDGERDRADLRAAQLFAKHDRAEENAEQRVDVVAERRLQRAVVGDRPDIGAPVEGDQRRGQRAHGKRARRAQRLLDVGRAPHQEQQHAGDRHRPDDAVRHHFGRRNMRDRLHVEGQPAPQQVARQRVEEAAPGVGVGDFGAAAVASAVMALSLCAVSAIRTISKF